MQIKHFRTDTDDSVLWTMIIGGDRNALGKLYDRYYLSLLNYGLKFSFDREMVKDSIQDLFVNIFGNTHLTAAVAVRPYLFRSLKNIILKKIEGRRFDEIEDYMFRIPENDGIFELMFRKDDGERKAAEQLVSGLKKLSSNQRQILYLRFVSGLSHKEIAEIMNINEQSSMNIVHRAVKKLRSLIDERSWILCVALILRHLNSFS